MRLKFYGKNFVVLYGTVLTKEDVIREYKEFAGEKAKTQKARYENDLRVLAQLDKKMLYEIAIRQYTGHRNIPSSTRNSRNIPSTRIFLSLVISW